MRARAPAWTCLTCREGIEAGFDACWNCGTDRTGRQDPGFRRADEPDPPRPPSAGVSAICPACGRTDHRPTRPAGWIAFAPDRLCTGCGTRYTPPTPRWAGAVFVLLGTTMVLGAIASGLIHLAAGNLLSLPNAVFDALFGVLGGAAVRYGVRALRHTGGDK